MAWIKRNLLFVISGAVGLILTGYCGFLLYKALGDNSGVTDTYQSTLANLEGMEQKTPYPSSENIKAVKSDSENIKGFLAEFQKSFAPFPPPPVENDKGFKIYLAQSLVQFRAEATNAGVELPPDYSFSFSSLREKLNYPPGSIASWMRQLEEIRAILDILYRAKINYLSSLCRVPVSVEDSGSGDCMLSAATVTNQLGVVTPYKITFRGFSSEVAAVLEGFARASNCFIVQAIDVSTDKSVQQQVVQAAPEQPMMTFSPTPQLPVQNRFSRERMERGERPVPAYRPPPTAGVPAAPPAASAVAPPVVILSENPLLVTLSVDVINLKPSEH